MGSFGTIQEKSLLQDATVSMIKTVPVMMNMYFPTGRLLKSMRLSLPGSMAILLMFLGSTTAHDFQGFMNNPFAGRALYQTHCLRCHGHLGDGKGPDAATLTVPPRNFHTPESTARNEYELRSIIIWGLVFSPMHSWGHRLTPQEIRDLISYIRQLAPYQPRI